MNVIGCCSDEDWDFRGDWKQQENHSDSLKEDLEFLRWAVVFLCLVTQTGERTFPLLTF